MTNPIEAANIVNKWDDSIFEMIADIERQMQKATGLPYYLLSAPERYQAECRYNALRATELLRKQHEAMIKVILEPANFYTDPAAYATKIRQRLDNARAKADEDAKARKANHSAIDCLETMKP